MIKWKVHKFGGTSVAGADRYRKVAEIVRSAGPERQGVVVSAMSGVTDALLALIEAARTQDPSFSAKVEELRQKHLKTIAEIGSGTEMDAVKDAFEHELRDLGDLLRAVQLARSASREMQDLIAGHGEIWSARFLRAQLSKDGVDAVWLDARKVLVVSDVEIGVSVDWEKSRAKLFEWLAEHRERFVVITGFIASTPEGIPTTLRRNGSDFSATIFASLLDAESVTIWKEVDGILSANPKLVPEAIVLDEMTYEEASELAYFGAKVLHPSTMAPVISKKIPILIRNSMDPSKPGTRVQAVATSKYPVKGFTTIDTVALVNVEGTGMIGVPGVAHRLFGALREVGVSVILISQASSEHSICFAIPESDATKARTSLERVFYAELQQQQIQQIQIILGCSILAVVGDRMVEQKGVAAQFFGNLSRANVNIRAIAQGSSERNISVVVDRKNSERALKAAHSGFYLSDRVVSVGLVGPGSIGKALLEQLKSQEKLLSDKFHIRIHLRAISDSKRMLLSDRPIPLDVDPRANAAEWEKNTVPVDLLKLADHVVSEPVPHSVLIDCSASEEVSKHYPEWMKRGAHVVTPNKKAGSGPYELYRKIRNAEREFHRRFFYEATVGAGLPVISSLQDLIHTGDQIRKIEGVFSGTLSFVFNTFSDSKPFSEVITEARKRGYTEPDPRDDLSGRDVARKLIILAREIGLKIELDEIPVESLVPSQLKSASVDEFMARLPEFDQVMAAKFAEAKKKQEVLRYVGVIEVGADGAAKTSVRLASYPATHSFARISGSDNIIAFTTERYLHQPLVVQGPGAGPAVTAAGVFADLLRLMGAER